MFSYRNFSNEYSRAADLTDAAISDLQILSNITTSVNTLASQLAILSNKSNALIQNVETTDKALFLAAKLPLIGGAISFTRAVANTTIKPFEAVDDALDEIGSKAGAVSSALDKVTLALFTGNVAANAAKFGLEEQARVQDQIDEPIEYEERLGDEAEYNRLKESNDLFEQYVVASQPARDALTILDFNAWDLVSGNFENFERGIDNINAIFGEIARATDELLEYVEPVAWALDAAKAVQEEILDPILNAALEATGLNDLLSSIASRVADELGAINDFKEGLQRIAIDLDRFDVAGLVDDFWSDFEITFEADGPIDFLGNLSAQAFRAENGDLLIIGSRFDDTLEGEGGDDDIFGMRGDDSIDGGAGEDRALYLHDITDYRLTEESDGTITVDSLLAGDDDEGTDTLRNIENVRFDTFGLGDVSTNAIRDFQYVTSGSPDLTGDDGDNWLFGDNRANSLNGGDGKDRLFGAGGNDRLNGGAGEDTIFGGDGDDTIFVDVADGLDAIFGGDGTDRLKFNGDDGITLDFATGAAVVGGTSTASDDGTPFRSIEIVEGTSGDDTYLMAAGGQTIATGGGNDQILYAGAGDRIISTDGSDRTDQVSVSFKDGGYVGVRLSHQHFFGDPAGTVALHQELIPPGTGPSETGIISDVSIFEGTDFADVFYAFGTTGVAQDDDADPFEYEGATITGSVMLGGKGTDVFFASERANHFDGGEDFDLVNFSLDQIIANRLSSTVSTYNKLDVDLEIGIATTGSGQAARDTVLRDIEGIVGSRNSDVIRGDEKSNYLSGGLGGNDTINGRGGNDYIEAIDLANPVLIGGDGNDIFAITASTNGTIDGGNGSDTLELLPGQEFRLDAYFEAEIFALPEDALTDSGLRTFQWEGWNIDLGLGTAIGYFGVQNDKTLEPNISDHELTSVENVRGSHLDDEVIGSDADNILTGRAGDDSLFGGAGNDKINGGDDDDLIEGGADDDFLVGGAGSDTLRGGDGNDTLVAAGIGDPTDSDTLSGGAGADTFMVGPNEFPADFEPDATTTDPFPVIEDFDPAEDKIVLLHYDSETDLLEYRDVPGVGVDVVVNDDIVARLLGVSFATTDAITVELQTQAVDDDIELDLNESNEIVGILENDSPSSGGTALRLSMIAGRDISEDEAVGIELPSGAILELAEDGTLRFDPNGAYDSETGPTVTETFTYEASDDTGSFQEARVTLNITLQRAEAVDDTAQTDADTSLIISPLENDLGTGLRITGASTDKGTVEVINDSTLRFSPAADDNGTANISYQIEDARGETSEGQVVVDILAVNTAPLAVDDVATLTNEEVAKIDVLANDTDTEGDPLSLVNVSADLGTAAIMDGQIVYTPPAGYEGSATVSYTVSDGTATDTGQLLLAITAANPDGDVPGVSGDDEEIPGIPGDDGETPGVPGDDGETPANPGSGGDDGGDGDGGGDDPFVPTSPSGDNAAPTLNPDAAEVPNNQIALIDVLANDSDPDGDLLELINVSSDFGTVGIVDGKISFQPDDGFVGDATITYTVSDGTVEETGTLVLSISDAGSDEDDGEAPLIPDFPMTDDPSGEEDPEDDDGMSFAEMLGMILLGGWFAFGAMMFL